MKYETALLEPLTLEKALELADTMCDEDRADALRVYSLMEDWAASRCALPGSAWALTVGGVVIAAGGVVSLNEDTGCLWLSGVEGWAMPYAIHAVRIWREVLGSGLYKSYQCECSVDRPVAQRFAERMGLKKLYVADGFVHYGAGV